MPGTLAWEPALGSLAWGPVLGHLFGDFLLKPRLGTLLGNLLLGTWLGNLFFGTFGNLAWEPALGNPAWEPVLGNPWNFWGTCSLEPLGTLLGNLAWERCLLTLSWEPGNFGNPAFGCSDLLWDLYFGWRPQANAVGEKGERKRTITLAITYPKEGTIKSSSKYSDLSGLQCV